MLQFLFCGFKKVSMLSLVLNQALTKFDSVWTSLSFDSVQTIKNTNILANLKKSSAIIKSSE